MGKMKCTRGLSNEWDGYDLIKDFALFTYRKQMMVLIYACFEMILFNDMIYLLVVVSIDGRLSTVNRLSFNRPGLL